MGDNRNLLKEYIAILVQKRLDEDELSREYNELEGKHVRNTQNFTLNNLIDRVDRICFISTIWYFFQTHLLLTITTYNITQWYKRKCAKLQRITDSKIDTVTFSPSTEILFNWRNAWIIFEMISRFRQILPSNMTKILPKTKIYLIIMKVYFNNFDNSYK